MGIKAHPTQESARCGRQKYPLLRQEALCYSLIHTRGWGSVHICSSIVITAAKKRSNLHFCLGPRCYNKTLQTRWLTSNRRRLEGRRQPSQCLLRNFFQAAHFCLLTLSSHGRDGSAVSLVSASIPFMRALPLWLSHVLCQLLCCGNKTPELSDLRGGRGLGLEIAKLSKQLWRT